VRLARTQQDIEASFRIDWHLVGLPIIDQESTMAFKGWLANALILRPIPTLMRGDSEEESLHPDPRVTDFGSWYAGLLANSLSVYTTIDQYLRDMMPDLKDIKNQLVGKDSRRLLLQFSNQQASITIPFENLSDGEKCYMVCALVLAANHAFGPILCFWDEPDNYLSLSEVGNYVLALRKAFQSGGQFIATSHNPEAIRRFSEENTLVLYRNNHLEPTIARPLSEIQVSGDLVNALVRGDVEL
jgi:predicted ATPase